MSRENEKITTTLENLAKLMATVSAKYIGEDSDWALKNWEIFLHAAEGFKDGSLSIDDGSCIINAAIDYMQGLDNSGFADEFGGIDFLKDNLVKAIAKYQS